MTKVRLGNLCLAAAVAGVIFCAVLMRAFYMPYSGVWRTVLYNILIFSWAVSVWWRILHAQTRRCLLGAAALRDIGYHFPDTDPAYKGANSLELLKIVGQKLTAAGYRVGNIDVTMIAQRPKLKDFIPQMEENIAHAVGIAPSRVNVKATTEEHLGFTGTGEGMSCHAVCLLEEAV